MWAWNWCYLWNSVLSFNTLRLRQNGLHFPDIFKCIFLNENVWISIKISLKFVPKDPINNIPPLVEIMAWRRQNGDLVLGLFLDFSKVFDTVDHDILLDKLEFCGIRVCAHDWFKSYLTNRKQFVEFDSHTSSLLSITCGVDVFCWWF